MNRSYAAAATVKLTGSIYADSTAGLPRTPATPG